MIDADAALVEALRSDDTDALDQLIDRYGAPVSSGAAAAADAAAADSIAHDVFVQAWRNSGGLEPGSDFGPWLRGLTSRVARARGADLDDDRLSRVWAASSAIGNLTGARRDALAAWCQGGSGPETGNETDTGVETGGQQLVADRVRIERKLAGRVEGEQPGDLLSDPAAWAVPSPDLAERVQRSVHAESTVGAPHSEHDGSDAPTARISQRLMRTVLIALLCAFAVLIGMIVLLSALSSAPSEPDYSIELTPTGLVPGVSGEVTVTGSDAGVELEIDAPTLPRRGGDQNYRAVVILNDGTAVTLGSFREGASVTLTGGVDVGDVAEFLVANATVGEVGPVADTDVVLKATNFQR